MSDEVLPIAHRVWAVPLRPRGSTRKSRAKPRLKSGDAPTPSAKTRKRRVPKEPNHVLFFDTETTVDHLQKLTFGCWRYCRVEGDELHCVDEGLIYGDDLSSEDLDVLGTYVANHQSDTERNRPLRLMSRAEFVERAVFEMGFESRTRIVGFNLPFDLARLAIGVREGRQRNHGGFSLVLWPGKAGTEYRERRHRPRINVKSLDSKGAFISFTKALGTEDDDLVPEDSADGAPDLGYRWRGRFVDLSTLAFALTGETHSLDSACAAFGVEGKVDSGGHGVITEHYVDYCRQDVSATQNLYTSLMSELRLHPTGLEPEKAFSPASLAKSYLTAMGIDPPLQRFPDFPPGALGYAMSSFFGGRAECRIRRVPVPVSLVDFTSMYPLVDALLDLHRFNLAASIDVEDSTDDVRAFLATVTLNDCLDPRLWPRFVGFVRVRPDRDVLPVRAKFNGETFNIAVTPLASDEPLWYSLADCVAAKLLTGKAPEVVEAIRLVPRGNSSRLRSVKVRGTQGVDPSLKDPMTAMTEERQRVKRDKFLDPVERKRRERALKIIVNAGSYGIYSEFNARESRVGENVPVRVHGRTDPFDDRVAAPEEPGRYCFPPFASCITGAARLMLAVLERLVSDLGGTWAFCDTDSMAIVATESGGLVPCPGGAERLVDGTTAVRALSFGDVESLRKQINALNPFDLEAVPHILKREADAMCFAVSVKRYALYELDAEGRILFVDGHPPSENGLGHFLNPAEHRSANKEWVKDVWRVIIGRALGHAVVEPSWFGRPTMVRTTVSSTPVLRAFRRLNVELPYSEQVKPFNFMLTASGAKPPSGLAIGSPFRLVAPHELDGSKWEDMAWIDVHHPELGPYRISTRDGRPGTARIDTFADVVAKYETHPESKALGPDGKPCGRMTIGLLSRRPVIAGRVLLIGKEANRLEERSSGELTVNDLDQHLTTYHDDDEWIRFVLPRLKDLGAKFVAEVTGVSERRVRAWFTGESVPHVKMRGRLVALAEPIERGRP